MAGLKIFGTVGHRKDQEMLKMKLLKAALLSLLSTPVMADVDSIGVILGYHHVNSDMDFEEGLGQLGVCLSFDGDLVNSRPCVYENSLGGTSTALTFTSDYLDVSQAGFNLTPFAGLGYYPEGAERSPLKFADGNLIPLFGVEMWHDEVPLFAQVLPGSKEYMGFSALVTVGVRIDF